LEYIFKISAKEIFGQELSQIHYNKGRNEDRLDADLVVRRKDGKEEEGQEEGRWKVRDRGRVYER
jgi:hypothetical protein